MLRDQCPTKKEHWLNVSNRFSLFTHSNYEFPSTYQKSNSHNNKDNTLCKYLTACCPKTSRNLISSVPLLSSKFWCRATWPVPLVGVVSGYSYYNWFRGKALNNGVKPCGVEDDGNKISNISNMMVYIYTKQVCSFGANSDIVVLFHTLRSNPDISPMIKYDFVRLRQTDSKSQVCSTIPVDIFIYKKLKHFNSANPTTE